ncbi:DnaA regulatory inactivator Hda [Methyloglobulus sp.]|uniref:DnaA regulatory inactivator Hda n=1 Tax=Methyloglobulus sp. TaxID=2518622 RepID=UPI0017DF9DEA|nr:DnaA regulatory inactivator Hda [Methyloglobulus sp.]
MAVQLPVTFEFRANQTFDDYYPGSNKEIIDQLRKTVAGTGEQYIFLWGEEGYGKSHLLQACCHEAFHQDITAFYLDLSDSASTDPELFTGLEGFEIVCLDNIDALAGREDWELAFFNLFNQHRDQGNRLILSATCTPNSLTFTLPDLRTRINWGLSLKIQPLDDNDKIAALNYKAQQMGFDIAPQAARFLLTHYDRSLTSLWLILDKLDWASLAAKRKLTIPFLKQILDQRD